MQNLLESPSPPVVGFSENDLDMCKAALTRSAPSPLMRGLRWVYGQHFIVCSPKLREGTLIPTRPLLQLV